ncbi:MAG: peptidylprolyl isomerase [Deltaproteobacteria bacterium]|nr:peptidylprolyl isomerase [Deltaproteobacteria bacterium]
MKNRVLTVAVVVVACALFGACSKGGGGAKKDDTLYATLQTSMGDIKCKLFEKQAPKTIENFVGLATGKKEWLVPGSENMWVKKPLYDGTIFHRVIPDFMIQGGDPMGNGRGGPGYKFQDEFDPALKFDRPCLLAMANSGPNTNGSQFFVTEKPTPWLSNKHTIFGECDNLELVKTIARVEAGPGNRPKKDVTLKHVHVCRGQNPCVEVR